MLAGLLYVGSGIGLGLYRLVRRAPRVRLERRELLPLAGAVFFGGIVGPVLLMFGLLGMPASGASLLLNAEGVATALLAWFVFKENFDRRIALGMAAIVAGAVVLSWPGQADFSGAWPSLAILGACLAWGIDNNLTRKVALHDATWLAAVKGLVAGPVNLAIAFLLGASLPPWPNAAAAMLTGLLAYGISLVLFIVALRHIGTARAGRTSRSHRSSERCWRSRWEIRSRSHWSSPARSWHSGCGCTSPSDTSTRTRISRSSTITGTRTPIRTTITCTPSRWPQAPAIGIPTPMWN